jgi:cephalosporin-C deacetylase-like acetyl esterase
MKHRALERAGSLATAAANSARLAAKLKAETIDAPTISQFQRAIELEFVRRVGCTPAQYYAQRQWDQYSPF